MKKHIYFGIFATIALSMASCGNSGDAELAAADSTGLPGDNFSLAGALDIFKESKSLDDFEKKLNTKKNKVNNLDLNGDSTIDYIRVVDRAKGDAHAIVLQVPVNQSESQDVAVIEINKTGDKSATLQIVGNEMLYGDSAVVEPKPDGDEQTAEAAMVPGLFHNTVVGVDVNVWLWPPVAYVYEPTYVAYVSPWAWNVYPTWYEPWQPYPYGWYRREVARRHKGYHNVYVVRPGPAHFIYAPYRTNSFFVVNRYQAVYVKHGMPKMKGRKYYGPGGPVFYDNGRAKPFGGPGHGNPGKMKGGKGGMDFGPQGHGPAMKGGYHGPADHGGNKGGGKGPGGGPAKIGPGGGQGPSGGGKPSGGGGGKGSGGGGGGKGGKK